MKITILYENLELTEKIVKNIKGANIIDRFDNKLTIEFEKALDVYHFGRLEMMEEMFKNYKMDL